MAALSEDKKTKKRASLIHYNNLRRAIGIIGVLFPVILCYGVCVLGNSGPLRSISAYYHSNMRDVFVGILCVEAVLLFTYRGYDTIDNIIGNVGCISGLGTALFPTKSLDPTHFYVNRIVNTLHFIFAILFFVSLICFAVFLFTKYDMDEGMTPRKKKRNLIYFICGGLMALFLLLVLVYYGTGGHDTPLSKYYPVFWLESAALWAFGISWFVKGDTVLRDVEKSSDKSNEEVLL